LVRRRAALVVALTLLSGLWGAQAQAEPPRREGTVPAPAADQAPLWRLPERPVLALGGSALVVSLAALVTGLRARDVQGVLDTRCSADRVCTYDGFERDRERGQRLWNVSRGLAVGAALLGAGAISWWVIDRREQLATRLGLGLAAGGVEARLQHRF
jgi:hypothetical protein